MSSGDFDRHSSWLETTVPSALNFFFFLIGSNWNLQFPLWSWAHGKILVSYYKFFKFPAGLSSVLDFFFFFFF